MDVFKLEPHHHLQPASPTGDDKLTAQVSFDAGSEFNLSFFDTSTPEDSSTQGFSDDPDSISAPSSGESPTVQTQLHLLSPGVEVALQLSPEDAGDTALEGEGGGLLVPVGGVHGVVLATVAAAATNLNSGTGNVIVVKQEQHYVAADSNSSSTTKSFVPCKVCGDKASGYHYGVTSCEGCKGFFRRSIQKQIEYRCLRDGKCLVIRLNRNRCQYCRFKKCLAVGMSRDSVRYGRVPKRSRERSTEEQQRVSTTATDQPETTTASTTVNGDSGSIVMSVGGVGGCTVGASGCVIVGGEPTTKQLALYDVILTVSQAHHANCGYTEEHMRGLVRKPLACPSPSHQSSGSSDNDAGVATSTTADSLEQERCWLWQQFAARVTPSVQRVVEFAKRVPGFCDLGQDDQLILIKVGFFEIWLSHVARLTSSTSLVFDDGTQVAIDQIEIMYDVEFVSSVLQFTSSFNNYSLNDTELGLFSAVVLLTGDRPGITDVKLIEHLQDKLVEALKVQVSRNHASDPQLFTNLLVKLPELRTLGAKHTAHLNWFRLNWAKLTLPPLFAEIFDIPKCEDDLQ